MPEWDPEAVVDEALARVLLADQFPELTVERLRLLAEGWDNTVWLVNDRLVFRFPRRAIALPGVEREIAILPSLATRLPVAVPVPDFIGRPTDAYPWPFFGAQLIPGNELAGASLTDAARAALAPALGRFLRALHAPAVLDAFGDGLPEDPNRRADMALRVPMTRRRLAEVEEHGLWRQSGALAWLEAAEALPPSSHRAVTHGDLHLRHLLADETGRLSGVIDWGDMGRSDPAIDLPAYWFALPPDARPAFEAAYGPLDQAALLRARVLAVFLCGALALYAASERMANLEREAVTSLERSLRD